MKLLIATPLYPPDIGGPATYAKLLEDELSKEGDDVQVVSYHRVRHLPKAVAYPIYALNIFLATRSCDILLALDPVHTGVSAWFAASIWNKPYALRVAGDYAWEQGKLRFGVREELDQFVTLSPNRMLFQVRFLRFVERFIAARARKVIVPSRYLASIVSQWGTPKERITVIYNAFEGLPPLLPKEVLREKFGLSGTILFSAGRLVPWKGFGTLIRISASLQKSIPDLKLLIAGSGPLEGELKRAVVEAHASSRVTLLGDVPHALLMEYIAASDCFVLNTGYEGLSHLLLETLAVGTPVVTTNVGGNPELINEERGVLVRYDAEEELIRTIISTLSAREAALARAKAGKDFAQGFTVERMVGETRLLLKELTDRRV